MRFVPIPKRGLLLVCQYGVPVVIDWLNIVLLNVSGRVLILEGIEKAESNVLPTLNNLLENRYGVQNGAWLYLLSDLLLRSLSLLIYLHAGLRCGGSAGASLHRGSNTNVHQYFDIIGV